MRSLSDRGGAEDFFVCMEILRRPYGTGGVLMPMFPALKCWANEHCTYGARAARRVQDETGEAAFLERKMSGFCDWRERNRNEENAGMLGSWTIGWIGRLGCQQCSCEA